MIDLSQRCEDHCLVPDDRAARGQIPEQPGKQTSKAPERTLYECHPSAELIALLTASRETPYVLASCRRLSVLYRLASSDQIEHESLW